MQCCVPSCGNTSDNVSASETTGITFHGLPSEQHLRAAWLRALGAQEHHLPDLAVVCSQHFLDEDFYETHSSERQIRSYAMPSMVQMCMICLDTDSKLCVMSRHKLQETYEQLTGLSLFQLCSQGNLKQTLCVLCARRLINFSRFRDLSLRAHSLMTDLVEQHGFMTTQHIELANNATEHLKCNLTQTTLATNHCDLYIDHTDEEEQTAAEESAVGDVAAAVVKNEDSSDSMSRADNLELAQADDGHIDNPNNDCVSDDEYSDMSIKLESRLLDEAISEALHRKAAKHAAEAESSVKSESVVFGCTFCFGDFVQEDDYNEHMRTHLQNAGGDAACGASQASSHSVAMLYRTDGLKLKDDPPLSADSAQDLAAPLSARLVPDEDNKVRATEEAGVIQKSDQILQTYQSDTKPFTDINRFTNCVVLLYDIFKKPNKDVQDENARAKPHTGRKPYSCDTCNYKTVNRTHLLCHKRIHTGEKPYTCDLCYYKFSRKDHLLGHLKTHTGEKPYTCDLCHCKYSYKRDLLRHSKTHTGEKPYTCDLCHCKYSYKRDLLRHSKTHTGEKPYSCETCNYKCVTKSNLSKHKRTHTGEKPYTCDLCHYKFSRKDHLLGHLKTHTGEKPYTCDLCHCKYSYKCDLLRHSKTHTGEKPYSCETCNYKCVTKSNLSKHKRTHTGEKPYTCDLCHYKFSRKDHLLGHLKTHTGE